MPSRRLPIVILALAAVLSALLLPHSAGAETDAERERERVRQEQAAAAANVDALEADQEEVMAALSDLEAQVAAEEEARASAERELKEAEAAQARAQEGIEEAEAHVAEVEERLREQVVELYTAPDGGEVSILDAESATDMVKRQAILDGRAADDEDLVDQVRRAQAELRVQRREAVAAGERAEAQRQEVQARIESLQVARDQQQAFADDLQQRVDAEVARGIELQDREDELSQQIFADAAAFAARIAAIKQTQAEQAAAAAAAAEANAVTASYNDSGAEPSGPVAPPASSGGPVGSGTGGIAICNAAGITVNCQIQSQVSALVAAAAADGLTLSGGGYRDPSQQIELRKQNCGTSQYAIYEMPSSQCSPPTARPGSSQHELGLAIDFRNCSTRSTPCYQWLNANAARFGLYNLPSEAWHWSVNGN